MTGIFCVLMIGPTVAVPAPEPITSAVEKIQVTNTDGEHDGFQIIFSLGRSGQDLLDYSLIANPLLNPFNRVIIIVTFGFVPSVLIDGIITHKQFNPSDDPGQSKLTITGEDVSVMMDREEMSTNHPNQPDIAIVAKIIGSYSQYGLVPTVIPPKSMDIPLEIYRTPSQQETDLKYIRGLAKAYDHVFYVEPTSLPGVNKAYWGPKDFASFPQKAITTNMGSNDNASNLNFQFNSLDATMVTGNIQDPLLNMNIPIIVAGSLRPPLSAFPGWLSSLTNIKKKKYRASGGVNTIQAYVEAQSETDKSTDAVTVTGDLDGLAYGDVLRARRLVGLRGMGYTHDGLYYVKSVTHTLERGKYTQHFELTRDGFGSTTPVVPV